MESSQTLRRNTSQISHKHHQRIETFHHHQQHLQAMKLHPPYTKNSSRSRTHSLSSISSSSLSSISSSSLSHHNPNYSPLTTPNSTPLRFSGKPFSWEYFPGIPKIKQLSKSKNLQDHHTNKHLPLPPPTTRICKKTLANPSFNKRRQEVSFESDPFFAALVECSKGGGDQVEVDDEGEGEGEDEEEEFSGMSSGENFRTNIIAASAKAAPRSFSDRFGFVSLYASCKRTCAVAESIRDLPRSAGRSNYDLISSRSAR